jgi:hypothetical protein
VNLQKFASNVSGTCGCDFTQAMNMFSHGRDGVLPADTVMRFCFLHFRGYLTLCYLQVKSLSVRLVLI